MFAGGLSASAAGSASFGAVAGCVEFGLGNMGETRSPGTTIDLLQWTEGTLSREVPFFILRSSL